MPTLANSNAATKTEITTIVAGSAYVNVVNKGASPAASGATNQTAIQAAIDEVGAAGGGTVYIPAGTYNVNLTDVGDRRVGLQINASNVTLYIGPGCVLRIADNQSDTIGADAHHLILVGFSGAGPISNVKISGPGTLVGNTANNTGMTGSTDNLIAFGYAVTPVVSDCELNVALIRDWDSTAVKFIGSDPSNKLVGVYVHDCTLEDVAEYVYFQHCERIIFSNNILRNTKTSGTQDGFEVAGANHVTCSDNLFYDISGSAIDIFSTPGTGTDETYNISITGNTIHNAFSGATTAAIANAAIDCLVDTSITNRGGRVTIGNNTIFGCKTNGIAVGVPFVASGGISTTAVVIADNIIEDCEGCGIALYKGGKNHIVKGNIIRHCGGASLLSTHAYPLFVYSNGTTERNVGHVITDNQFIECGAATVIFLDADYCVVANNIVTSLTAARPGTDTRQTPKRLESTQFLSFTAPSTINYTGPKNTDRFVVGDVIRTRGASNAANNADLTIASLTATTIVVNEVSLVTEAVSGRLIRVYQRHASGAQALQVKNTSIGNMIHDNIWLETDTSSQMIQGAYLGDATSGPNYYYNNLCIGASGADFSANATALYRAWSNVSNTTTAANNMPDELQSIAYAASITPNARLGRYVEVGTLTAGITINAPTNPSKGQPLTFRFLQDATGTRTITWNAVFNIGTIGLGTANQKLNITFQYDGSEWVQQGSVEWV